MLNQIDTRRQKTTPLPATAMTTLARSTPACPLLLKTMYAQRPDVFRTGTMPSKPSFTLEQWEACLPAAVELAESREALAQPATEGS